MASEELDVGSVKIAVIAQTPTVANEALVRVGCHGADWLLLTPVEALETREWQDSLDYVLQQGGGVARAAELLRALELHARQTGHRLPFTANTPYINTIPVSQQPAFPGNQAIERRIKSLVRWNALSMVVRANKLSDGIGGHI